MGVCAMNGANGPAIESVEQMFGRFNAELVAQFPQWSKRLEDDPLELAGVEHDVQAACVRGAGMIVAGLVAVVLMSQELAAASAQTRQQFREPLSRGRNRPIRVRLLGGFAMWISSLYCEPKKSDSGPGNRMAAGTSSVEVMHPNKRARTKARKHKK